MTEQLNETEVYARTREVLCEVLNVKPEEITPEATFTTDLGAESLDMISMVSELEDAFDTDITDEDAAKLKTVGDAVAFILDTLRTRAAAS